VSHLAAGAVVVGYPHQGRKYEAEPSAAADDHLERQLLSSEVDRLRRENAQLKSALRTAGKVLGPYLADDGSRRR
jgi:hypothetical protein